MEGSGFLTFQNRLSSTWSNKTNNASHDQEVDLALRLGLPSGNQEAPFHGVIPQNFNNNINMPAFHQQGMGNGGILLQNAGGHERNIDFSRRFKHRPWPLPVLNMVSNNWNIMSGNSGQQQQQQKKICKMCDRTETPLWRKGPDGPKTLCNGCGLRYARVIKRR